MSEEEVLLLAGAAEARSGHPLAQAVLDEMTRRAIQNDAAVEDFENVAGHGVRARVAGREMLVGAARLLERFEVPLGDLAQPAAQLTEQAKTLILVAADGRAVGVIAAADVVRPNAATAIADLKSLGIEPVMMTGDTGGPRRPWRNRSASNVSSPRCFRRTMPPV